MSVFAASLCMLDPRFGIYPDTTTAVVFDLGGVAFGEEHGYVQAEQCGRFGSRHLRGRHPALTPIHEPRNEIRLSRPLRSVAHAAVIAQSVDQQRIELGGPQHDTHGHPGETTEDVLAAHGYGSNPQEFGVVTETGDQVIDVVTQPRSTPSVTAAPRLLAAWIVFRRLDRI